MLQKNPLLPPRPARALRTPAAAVRPSTVQVRPFVSAEDFDATGILAGVDPCESRYWWMPDLSPPADPAPGDADHATSRSSADGTATA